MLTQSSARSYTGGVWGCMGKCFYMFSIVSERTTAARSNLEQCRGLSMHCGCSAALDDTGQGAHEDAVARGRRKVGGALHGKPHRLARQAQLRVRQCYCLMTHAAPYRAGAIPYAKLCGRALHAEALSQTSRCGLLTYESKCR